MLIIITCLNVKLERIENFLPKCQTFLNHLTNDFKKRENAGYSINILKYSVLFFFLKHKEHNKIDG